jgi:hypothetical protein
VFVLSSGHLWKVTDLIINKRKLLLQNIFYVSSAILFIKHNKGRSPFSGKLQGRIQDFKLGGAHLIKLRRAEGGTKIVWVFRVKNHDFTPKRSYFSNFRGGARYFWGISCGKSRIYAKKIIFLPILGVPPPLNPPLSYTIFGNKSYFYKIYS